MKYGSFIPLSETDVLEYLKSKGNSDLSNRSVCTQTLLLQASVYALFLNSEQYSVITITVYQMNNDVSG